MMRSMSDSVKRQYRSPGRAAAAAATRARIRAAAADLFVQQGYVATTLRDVARHAGVGERTLYDSFPNKVALFGHTLGVTLAGDELQVPIADRPQVLAAREEPDPATAIRLMVEYTAVLLNRAGDLIMVSVEAAGADPDMRAAADAGAKATHELWLAITRELNARAALTDGLTAMAAADIAYALASPHMHQLLRRHRRWSTLRYRDWLETTLIDQLLR